MRIRFCTQPAFCCVASMHSRAADRLPPASRRRGGGGGGRGPWSRRWKRPASSPSSTARRWPGGMAIPISGAWRDGAIVGETTADNQPKQNIFLHLARRQPGRFRTEAAVQTHRRDMATAASNFAASNCPTSKWA